MPTAPKPKANMSKHLTDAELEARREAEAETLPDRGGKIRLKKPAFVARNKPANTYWNQITKRMAGLSILDDLDSEMLAGYCSMLARRDQTILLNNQLLDQLGVKGAVDLSSQKKPKDGTDLTDAEWEDSARKGAPAMTPDELIEAVSKLDTLTGKLQSLERNLLQYAEKLGLTPTGRVRLAQKRAAQATDPGTNGDDLYGD
jgi:phage terminase small subunit